MQSLLPTPRPNSLLCPVSMHYRTKVACWKPDPNARKEGDDRPSQSQLRINTERGVTWVTYHVEYRGCLTLKFSGSCNIVILSLGSINPGSRVVAGVSSDVVVAEVEVDFAMAAKTVAADDACTIDGTGVISSAMGLDGLLECSWREQPPSRPQLQLTLRFLAQSTKRCKLRSFLQLLPGISSTTYRYSASNQVSRSTTSQDLTVDTFKSLLRSCRYSPISFRRM